MILIIEGARNASPPPYNYFCQYLVIVDVIFAELDLLLLVTSNLECEMPHKHLHNCHDYIRERGGGCIVSLFCQGGFVLVIGFISSN